MRDWRVVIRERLAGARVSPAREADVVEELAQHLDDRAADLRARGVPEGAAERQVLAELEGSDLLLQTLRDVGPIAPNGVQLGGDGGDGVLRGWWQDVRFALRMFAKNPVFTVAAVLAIGLGTGSATAVFSLLNGIVLQPLAFKDPGALVMIWDTKQVAGLDHERLSPVNLLDYRAMPGVFDDVAAWWRPQVNLVDDTGEPMRVSTVETSENLFKVLGVDAILGRTFVVDSTLHSDEAEAVISYALWSSRFGRDTSVIGRAVRMNGLTYTIIGVMPPGFHYPENTDVWQHLNWNLARHCRCAHFMEAVGRLLPGVTLDQANRELASIGRRLASEFPDDKDWSPRAVPLQAEMTGVFRPGLYALFGATGLLLLIACINVANLLLARGAARQAEVAVRAALGASRRRLIRQILLESVVLAVLGTVAGFLTAAIAVRGLLAWTPIEIPRADEVHINGLVLLFSAGVALVTSVIFGLAPAIFSSRTNLQSALREKSRGATGHPAGRRTRNILVVAEVALAVALLAGAGLLIRTVGALMNEETGVHVSNAIVLDVQLPDAQYRDWPKVEQFYSALMTAVRARPEILAAGAANVLPLENGWRIPFGIPGVPVARPEDLPTAQYITVDEGYFRALGVPLRSGRGFEARDDSVAAGVVIINETMAKKYWPNQDPVGQRLESTAMQIGPLGRRSIGQHDRMHEIIGVAADVKNASLKKEPEPAIYSPVRQFPFKKMFLFVRGTGAPASLVSVVREEVKRLDPGLPLGEVKTLDRVLAAGTDPFRLLMLLMTVFAALALTLAAIGIYGILSYTVTHRHREIGIRLALGAQPREVLSLFMREGLGLATLGALIGVAVALAGGRLLSGLLYGVKPTDPVTMSAVVVVMIAIAGIACAAPSLRAAHTDPVKTLHE